MANDIESTKRLVAIANRILSEVGLAKDDLIGTGHVSMRVESEPDKFVVKGRGYTMDVLPKMQARDMVLCDLDGYWLEGPPETTQCGEVKLHSAILKRRPDLQAVAHSHAPHITIMSLLADRLRPASSEGFQAVFQPIPVYEHMQTVHSEEEGEEVADLLADGKVVILKGHGVVTAGRSPAEAVMSMSRLEYQAMLNWKLYCAAGPNYPYIPDEMIHETMGRPQMEDLPHFAKRGVRIKRGGDRYDYLAEIVSRDLD
jgi:ribulose-5-phosphate 4-epimerase/fuculose-1-phosphate aldolase